MYILENMRVIEESSGRIAALWKRFAALLLVDSFSLGLLLVFTFLALGFVIPSTNLLLLFNQVSESRILSWPRIMMYFMIVLYNAWFVGKSGQTPGMKAFHIKVIDADCGPIGFRTAFLRSAFFAVYVMGWFGICLSLLSVILAFIGRDKRFLHDRICGTMVVCAPDLTAPAVEQPDQKPRLSRPAVVVLVLSFFSLLLPVLGQIACFVQASKIAREIKLSNNTLRGGALARAAISISLMGLLIYLPLVFIKGLPILKDYYASIGKPDLRKIVRYIKSEAGFDAGKSVGAPDHLPAAEDKAEQTTLPSANADFKTREEADDNLKVSQAYDADKAGVASPESDAVTIFLKSGETISGRLLERKEDHIKINFDGVVLTYYPEEIERTDPSFGFN